MIDNIIRILSRYSSIFLLGLFNTLWMAFLSILFGTVLGTFIALGKLSKRKILNTVTGIYIEVLRGTPMLLQLYFFWILVPRVIPGFSDTQSVMVALIINSSAYVAECIRAGIQAVDYGQREAALSLGLSESNVMKKVILPQAVKNILPALGNEFVVMIKETSLASVFFAGELMTAYKTVQSATFLALEPLTIAGLIYLLVTVVLTRLLKKLEWRLRAND